MKCATSALFLALLAATEVASFSPATGRRPSVLQHFGLVALHSSSSSQTAQTSTAKDDPLGLTPELRKLTDAFERIGDDKLRYKQLLYMASNGLDAMPDSLKTDENKVLGCLSTVHVHATAVRDEKSGETLVNFKGDSDGLLTKGLVALLVRGLSGNTPEQIQKVDPSFIKVAGIAQSLTPGRNNGFLNMLALMKRKAKELAEADGAVAKSESSSEDQSSDRPMYNGIISALQVLQPTQLELVDNSHQHAGHAGNTGNGTESHFQLTIVADAFEGLNLVKRHKLVYMMLGEIMPKIHALQIQAMTPEEVAQK